MSVQEHRNGVLSELPPPVAARLEAGLTRVSLELGRVIYEPGQRVETVYFPLSALLSQVNRDPDGLGVETAMVGRDGAGGVLETLGSGHAVWESMVQVDGEALRADARFIRRFADEEPAFMAACWRCVEGQAYEAQQSVMCQARHSGEQRLARWLLEAHARTGGRNPLPLTQEIMATMLGVQRTTVTAFHLALKERGLLRGVRGRVQLLDVAGLEAVACECRRRVEARNMLIHPAA